MKKQQMTPVPVELDTGDVKPRYARLEDQWSSTVQRLMFGGEDVLD